MTYDTCHFHLVVPCPAIMLGIEMLAPNVACFQTWLGNHMVEPSWVL